ncbi:high affinity cGMP-specific 3',5'-cyclic phosphodiesterase 9A-like isoform X1 [Pseudoliparis swirei]|uniref:high affinity cGMP-specific 3',5'-cyclic phosphodiesterase 9A-like isoform X1 n=1 Tax=Pseudoliparis swirei TaxID=2059687 RepID=UPI0024BDDCC7|nr:high affinity cGMP-specific 3',5'-cyclic phosphodiesterase 9A-like isoform X1 [Pseudoliparis swirei]XP_056286857.1 high affinity cGMP-specific 3',5'-cyclic phosphodiesterase 9A-like isoform X1 [Pseudoliparis swirei]
MTTKIIHFTVNGAQETAELEPDCSAADVKDVFWAAAEAEPDHILKLYSVDGVVLNISPLLEANSRDSSYRLEVVASDPKSVGMPNELEAMEHRLQQLEGRVLGEAGQPRGAVCDLTSQVESFKKKLESVKHLSWMGLFKEDGDHQLEASRKTSSSPMSAQQEHQQVRRKFLNMSSLQVTEEVREHLKTPTFDNWQWEEAEMLVLLQVIFTDLDFLTAFHIRLDVLQNFLFQVFCHYNNIPFHNFRHCFCVTQMMYGLIWLTDLKSKVSRMDLLVMLTSALCHDLDHPGYNNVFQINAQTDLALRYNDISPLENHHCAVAFGIMAQPECNILKNLSSDQYKHIRGGMIRCILATDMARHNEILHKFKSIQPVFNFTNREHKEVLMKIMMKVSDISNEARPMAVAEPWLDCLLQEFFNQSDTEKLKGLPVASFMDRDKVSKPSSQTGFIRFVLLPLFTEITKLFPCLEEHILEPVRRALDFYSDLERASKQEEEEGRSSSAGAAGAALL